MSIMDVIGFLTGAAGFVAFIVSARLVNRSTTKNFTISSQKELIDTLLIDKEVQKSEIKDLQKRSNELTTNLAALQGQVDVLKTIPLKDISSDMRAISKEMDNISKTQHKIMEVMPKAL